MTVPAPLFAYVIANRIKNMAYLKGQIDHARRTSPTAETRPDATPGLALKYSIVADPDDYAAAHRQHLAQNKARCRGGSAIGLHLLIGVSRECVQEGGDEHGLRNPRNIQLLKEAIAFAEATIGGVIAARLDLDERGAGVVDVFVVPIRARSARSTKTGERISEPVPEVSVRKALKEAQQLTGEKREYGSLQTLWAQHARKTLDHRLVRGELKTETGKEHLTPVQFRQQRAEIARQLEEIAGRQATTVNHAARVYASEMALKKREEELAERAKQLQADLARHRHQALLEEMTAGILRAETLAQVHFAEEQIAQRERSILAREAQLQRGQDIFEQRIVALAGQERSLNAEKAEVSDRVRLLDQRETEIAATQAELERQVVEIANIAREAARAKGMILSKPRLEPGDDQIIEAAEATHKHAVKALRLTGVKLTGRGNGR
jgi:hypothetical protein